MSDCGDCGNCDCGDCCHCGDSCHCGNCEDCMHWIDCGNLYLDSGDCHLSGTIAIPNTTQETVIFASRQESFDRYYNPKDTDYKISSYQVDEVLTFVEDTLNKHLQWFNCFMKFFVGTVLFGILAFFFFWLLNLVRFHFNPLLFVVLVLIVVIWECIRQKEISNVKTICQQYLDHKNQTLARSGLRWNLPEQFPRWIELHNDWRKELNAPQNNPWVAPSQSNNEPSQAQSQGYEMVNFGSNNYNPPQQNQLMQREI